MKILVSFFSAITVLSLLSMEQELERASMSDQFKDTETAIELGIYDKEPQYTSPLFVDTARGTFSQRRLDLLRQTDLFKGEDDEEIEKQLSFLKKYNAAGYDTINEMVGDMLSADTKKIKNSDENIKSIEAKLLRKILKANQKSLEQAEIVRQQDAIIVRNRWILGLLCGVPSTVLSTISIIKLFS